MLIVISLILYVTANKICAGKHLFSPHKSYHKAQQIN